MKRLDSHVTGLEEKLRQEAEMNVMGLTKEYMSNDLANEYVERLRNIFFWRFVSTTSHLPNRRMFEVGRQTFVCGNSVFIQ